MNIAMPSGLGAVIAIVVLIVVIVLAVLGTMPGGGIMALLIGGLAVARLT